MYVHLACQSGPAAYATHDGVYTCARQVFEFDQSEIGRDSWPQSHVAQMPRWRAILERVV
jgi:hypothetical protein